MKFNLNLAAGTPDGVCVCVWSCDCDVMRLYMSKYYSGPKSKQNEKKFKKKMISIGRPHYAVFAGLSGSAASIFGKLISHCDTFTENFPTEQVKNETQWNNSQFD